MNSKPMRIVIVYRESDGKGIFTVRLQEYHNDDNPWRDTRKIEVPGIGKLLAATYTLAINMIDLVSTYSKEYRDSMIRSYWGVHSVEDRPVIEEG